MFIELVHDHEYRLETTDSCDNAGAACFGCPAFDHCAHAQEGDEE